MLCSATICSTSLTGISVSISSSFPTSSSVVRSKNWYKSYCAAATGPQQQQRTCTHIHSSFISWALRHGDHRYTDTHMCCQVLVHPDRVSCGLPKLFPRGRSEQGNRDSKHLLHTAHGAHARRHLQGRSLSGLRTTATNLFLRPPDQINTRSDVSPLVVAAKLRHALVVPRQHRKIVRLKQLVRELGETQANALVFQARLDGITAQHGLYPKMSVEQARARQCVRAAECSAAAVANLPMSRMNSTADIFR